MYEVHPISKLGNRESCFKTVYTRWTGDAAASFKAPVIKIAFMILPNGAGEEVGPTIVNGTNAIGENVVNMIAKHPKNILAGVM